MSRHRFIRNLSKEELLDDGLDDSEEEEEDDYSDNDDLGDIDEHEQRLVGQVHEVTAGAFTDRQVYDALYDTDGDVEAAVQILFDDGVAESLKKVSLESTRSKATPKAAPPQPPPPKVRTPIQSPAATRRPVKHGVSPSPSSRAGTPSDSASLAVPMRPSSSTASSRGTPKMPKKLALDPAKEWAKRQASVASKDVKPTVHVAVVGHVDTGKSTLVGHLLNLLQLVDAKTMRQHQKQAAAINKSSFVYAWALDSSAEERERGVTIDTATMSFNLPDTNIVILDNPGHKDFVANMIRGSCRADVGVLVISAMPNEFHSGFEGGGQTKEHAILLRSMGIRRILVAVNKMDQVEWAKSRFDELCSIMTDYLVNQIGFKPDVVHFVPVSGLKGINLVEPILLEGTGEEAALPQALTSWYSGPSLTGILNGCTPREMDPLGPTRFFVDDTSPGGMGNATVTCMGRLLRGSLQLQQQVLLLPQRLYGVVKNISLEDGTPYPMAFAGAPPLSIALTNVQPNEVETFTLICQDTESLQATDAFQATIKLFDDPNMLPLLKGSPFLFHAQGWEVPALVREMHALLDASDATTKRHPRVVQSGQKASVTLQLHATLPLESRTVWKDGARFLMRVKGRTIGAGLINTSLPVSEEKVDVTVFQTGIANFE